MNIKNKGENNHENLTEISIICHIRCPIVACAGNRVTGTISGPPAEIDAARVDHLRLLGNDLHFTFRRGAGGEIFEIQATLESDRMEARLFGTEDSYGVMTLVRMR